MCVVEAQDERVRFTVPPLLLLVIGNVLDEEFIADQLTKTKDNAGVHFSMVKTVFNELLQMRTS